MGEYCTPTDQSDCPYTTSHIRPYKVNSWFLSPARIIFIETLLLFGKGRHRRTACTAHCIAYTITEATVLMIFVIYGDLHFVATTSVFLFVLLCHFLADDVNMISESESETLMPFSQWLLLHGHT